MDAETTSQFEQDLRDVHIVYDYNVRDASSGASEKWRYEFWFFSSDRVVYKIHGGPMAGRSNYQACSYQCIRPGELWQCNWLEGAPNLEYARQQIMTDKPHRDGDGCVAGI
jgi:phenolic acid decarboxylase